MLAFHTCVMNKHHASVVGTVRFRDLDKIQYLYY